MIGLPELLIVGPILAIAAGVVWIWAADRGGWPARVALVTGSIVVLVVVTAGTIFVVANRSKIAALYRSAAGAFSEIAGVQRALQEQYQGTVSVALKHEGGVDATILSVSLVNPSFLDQLDPAGPEGKARAREIAAAARAALQNPSGYRKFEVVFVRQQGVGFTMTKSWVFDFDASELN